MSGRAQTIPGTQLFDCHVNHPFPLSFCPIHCLPATLPSLCRTLWPLCFGLGGSPCLYKSPVCAPCELHSPSWKVREPSPRTGSALGLRAPAAQESELGAFLQAASPGMAPHATSPTPAPCPGSPLAQPTRPCSWGALWTGWTSQLTP